MSEYDLWETRYRVPDYVFGREPNYFLAASKHLLPKSGRALVVADGEGRNGVWLARQGLAVVSLDFSPSAQAKASALAHEHGVAMKVECGDVHDWDYPEEVFDVVCEVFTQFSTPAERARKWAGMKKTLKRGGLLLLIGYTPKQLQYGTGGPKEVEHLYTRALLGEAFGAFRDVLILEEELDMHEGASHAGLSAVIHLTAWKPS